MAFQLSTYVSRFDSVCTEKFGRSYDFTALDTHFREHASGKHHLTARDVSKLFSPENTAFGRYWPRPHGKILEEMLKANRIYLGPLKDNRGAMVERLLSVFHDIGTASLILRFVHPDHFGIFSTPVVHLLLLLATWFGPLWRFNLAHPLGR